MRNRILVVENGTETCRTVTEYLQAKGYEIRIASSCSLAEQFCRMAPPDVVIIGCILPDGSSHRFIGRLKTEEPSLSVIVLANQNSLDQAMESVRMGANYFLVKPVDLSALSEIIARCLENQRIRSQHLAASRVVSSPHCDLLLGKSYCVRVLAEHARSAGLGASAVLIQGEAGTGKGSLACWLRQNGSRSGEPLVEVKCGSQARNLETELFGQEDASTASRENSSGLVEVAHRGTAVLREIGRAGLPVQSRLFRLLTEKKLRRLGSNRDRSVDIRLIATSRQSLPQLVREKRFRGDLYFCLSRTALMIPPLRERIEDLPILANQVLARLAAEIGTGDYGLSSDAVHTLQQYSWPGNDRELEIVLERAALLAGTAVLAESDLQLQGQHRPPESVSQRTLEQVEREYIEQVLRREGGRVQSAADKLGVPRSSLYHKLKQYQISRSGLRSVS
jgi:DNA-binding NtrC family response regulator